METQKNMDLWERQSNTIPLPRASEVRLGFNEKTLFVKKFITLIEEAKNKEVKSIIIDNVNKDIRNELSKNGFIIVQCGENKFSVMW